MTTTRSDVPGITCDHCRNTIDRAVRPLPGVHGVHVDVPAKSVTVEHDVDAAPYVTLAEVIEDEGYDVERFAEVS
jgi:copper chaperone